MDNATYHGVLDAWARECAYDVLYFWLAPPVVRQYLQSGAPTLQAAACAAAEKAVEAEADGFSPESLLRREAAQATLET